MANKKYYYTPEGVAVWPKLNNPDEKYNKYSCDVRLIETEEWTKLKSALDKRVEDQYEETITELKEKIEDAKDGKAKKKAKDALESLIKKYPYEHDVDEDGEEIEDQYILKINRTASGKRKDGSKWEFSVPLFDSQGGKLNKNVQVWGGSKVIVNFEAKPYYVPATGMAGISCALRAVQVKELVSGSGGNAESYGFKKHSDGYISEHEDITKTSYDSVNDTDEDDEF